MAQSTTNKEIELVIKGIDELDKAQKKFDELLVIVKEVNKELNKMSNFKTTNLRSEFGKLNTTIKTTNTTTRSLNKELQKTGVVSVDNKSVNKLNENITKTDKNVKELNKDLKEVKTTDVNNGSAKQLASDTNKAAKAEKELAAQTTKATTAMNKQTGATKRLSSGMLSLQTNATLLAVGTAGLVAGVQSVDSVVRELTYQFSAADDAAGTLSVGLGDLATSGIFTAEQMAALNTVTALTSFSLKDTADALLDLAKSGFDAAEAVGILTTSMMIADMENASLQGTVHALVGTMNAFGMSLSTSETAVEDFNAAANQMVLAADLTSNSVSDLTYGMRYMAPVANVLNMTFEETVALVATLGNAGLEASKGARTLASGLLRLIKPTEEVASEMEKLNIALFTASGEFVGIVPLVEQMEKAFAGMTEQQEALSMATLFGVEAIKSWNAVIEFGSVELQKLITELEKCGDSATYMAEKFLQVSLGLDSEGLASYVAELEKLDTTAQKVTYSLEVMAENNAPKFLEVLTEEVKKLALAFGEDLINVLAELAVKWLPEVKQLCTDIDKAVTDLMVTLGRIEPGENFDTSALVAQGVVFAIIAGAITLLVGAVTNFIIPGFKFFLIWKGFVAIIDKLKDLGVTFEELARAITLVTVAILGFRLIRGIIKGLTRGLNFMYRGIDKFYKDTDKLTKDSQKKSKSTWSRFFDDMGKLSKVAFGALNKLFSKEFKFLGKITGKGLGVINKIFGKGMGGLNKVVKLGLKKTGGSFVKGLAFMFVPFLKWGVILNGLAKIVFEDFEGIISESLERLKGNFEDLTAFLGDVKQNGWEIAWNNLTNKVMNETDEMEDGILDIGDTFVILIDMLGDLVEGDWAGVWEGLKLIATNAFDDILTSAQSFVTELSNILAEGLGWLQDKMGWGDTVTTGASGSANPNPDARTFTSETMNSLTSSASMFLNGLVPMSAPQVVIPNVGGGDYYSSDFGGNANYDQSSNSIVNHNNNSNVVVNYYAKEENVSSEFVNMINKLRGE